MSGLSNLSSVTGAITMPADVRQAGKDGEETHRAALGFERQMLQELTRRDLRHDAAERLMTLDLRRDEIHAHHAVALEKRNGGFIARSFDAENHFSVWFGRIAASAVAE